MDKVPWDKLIDAGVIGLTVTVILALVGWISSVLKEWMDRRRKARYLAVRIVPIIDQFLNDCSACLGDDGLLFGNADENGYTPPREKLPSTPDYPDDIDWLSIDHKIMYGLLLLPHQVKSATESILWMDLNVSTPPDFDEGFEARRGRLPDIAIAAEELAKSLRKKFKLPARDDENFNPMSQVLKAKKQSEKLIKERTKFINKMMSDIEPTGKE